MDLVSPIIDILARLWDCTAGPRASLCNFKENVESLRNVMRELDSVKEDVKQRVEHEEQQDYYLRRTERVRQWLEEADSYIVRANSLLQRGDEEIQKKCLGNCRSRYKLGKAIYRMILEVRDIVIRGHFDFVTQMLPRPPVEEIPLEKTVGIDSIFSQLWTLLQELECLENISDVSLTLTTFRSVLKFKASSKLQCCIKRLTIMCSELETLDIPSSAMKRMEHLETLSIRDCHSLRELKISFEEQGRMQGLPDCFRNLRYLHIENCPIKDLAWIRYCPSLRFLWVDSCPSLEEIIADDFGSAEIEENIDMLSKLESINLVGLPSLKSICRRAMLLPSLKDVEVINCPSLRKLPFDSDTAKNSLNAIKGIKTWWDQLEWEDAAAKDAFTSKFVDSDLVLFKPTAQSDYSKQLLRYLRILS
ncbi:hypothetical protein JRO89_XS09G0148000 [Xanthoceras sorbifolium]|uniref:Disease resistance protein At4g27190-like leucine-rich repeats domain-containing protein n=1 Tax=Xanthoceras sorbifolium TaxID=99658 RepID=A0ABQ8HLG9_9ROSI|nr:hypothetical protein JRO89_XS09G0148000 [Xanthoceras sorbifolium]